MAIEPSMSTYGSMTLVPPIWPGVDEDVLAAAAQSYEALAAQIRNVVVPQQQAQLVTLADQWTGVASQAAQAEGAQLIQGHENNATEAAAIANKLRLMEATVVRTKTAVNLTADETQANCDAIDATPAEPPEKEAAKAQAVAMGLAQNLQTVSSGTAELGGGLGTPQESSPASGIQGAQQAMQMAMQLGQQMLSQATRMGQQFGQQLGQLAGGSSPAQQMPASLGQLASSHSPAGMSSPSMFSNHPLAGGSGPTSGAGLMRPASFPGAGSPPQSGGAPGTPTTAGHGGGSAHGGGGGGAKMGRASLMANVTSSIMTGSAPASGVPAAGAGRIGGAPVAGGGGGMGGTGAMGHREPSGGTRAALAVPGALDHDLTDGAVDDEW